MTLEGHFLSAGPHLPVLLLDLQDQTTLFCLQLLSEPSQNCPVLPDPYTQSEPGPGSGLHEDGDQDQTRTTPGPGPEESP